MGAPKLSASPYRKRLTLEQRLLIVSAALGGSKYAQIARTLAIPESTVRRICKEAGA